MLFCLLPLLFSSCGNTRDILKKGDIRDMKERYIFNQNGRKAYMPLMYGLKKTKLTKSLQCLELIKLGRYNMIMD